MTKKTCSLALAFLLAGGTVFAGEGEQCLECHEPAEDWEGMSRETIVESIRAPDNKRHKFKGDITDEQIAAILAELLPQLPPAE